MAIFGAALSEKQQQTTDTATAAIAQSSSHVTSWLVSTFNVSIGLMYGLISHFLELPQSEGHETHLTLLTSTDN